MHTQDLPGSLTFSILHIWAASSKNTVLSLYPLKWYLLPIKVLVQEKLVSNKDLEQRPVHNMLVKSLFLNNFWHLFTPHLEVWHPFKLTKPAHLCFARLVVPRISVYPHDGAVLDDEAVGLAIVPGVSWVVTNKALSK